MKLIHVTNVHYDHAGNLKELKKLTGARVFVHASEADILRTGRNIFPSGTNAVTRILSDLEKHFRG